MLDAPLARLVININKITAPASLLSLTISPPQRPSSVASPRLTSSPAATRSRAPPGHLHHLGPGGGMMGGVFSHPLSAPVLPRNPRFKNGSVVSAQPATSLCHPWERWEKKTQRERVRVCGVAIVTQTTGGYSIPTGGSTRARLSSWGHTKGSDKGMPQCSCTGWARTIPVLAAGLDRF